MLFEIYPSARTLHKEDDAWLYVDELTHRTTSDYAAMLAAVEYASGLVSDPVGQRALTRVAQRLRGAAATHRALRPPAIDARSRLDVELEQLCEALCASLIEGSSISLTLYCDPVELSGRRCWQLCLILLELLRDAVRHEFADDRAAKVLIEVRQAASALHCIVADSGSTTAMVPGRGTRIINAIVADLGGRVHRVQSRSGSIVVLTLPVND